MGLEPEAGGGLGGEGEDLVAQAASRDTRRLEREDGRADLADGVVEVTDGGLDAGGELRRRQAHGALQRQAGGEEALDDGVVEVGGDALAVLDEREVGEAGVQAGVVDGDGGRRGQGNGQPLVLLAELGGRPASR